ncbi:MAG: 4-(cytidine 5'-diphospho)-2-C-methyl-D-erythritol kinase [Ignavibacteriales bacterium]|nr:4-(cytidine 5'-diphospho)-2-C-methyl-D-erythritol kinase [Ignavibacteriales bacterium]
MTLRAYAKINLGLQILGKRPDGYHDIETIFHQINLYDEIEIVQNESGVHFTTDSPNVPKDASNLCVRAATILHDLTGAQGGVEIMLRKRIPIGAGLGGGSSDAATVLKGICKLWDLEISLQELHLLSGGLGSDVPFFLDGGSAYATGRGEKLEPLQLSIPYWVVVVTPPVHISTVWAYSNFTLDPHVRHENIRALLQDGLQDPRTLVNKLRNDFEPLVFRNYPEIMRVKESLVKGGADFALMSGSGSSVFGLFSNEAYAKELAEQLRAQFKVSLTEPYFKPKLN